MAEWQSGRHRPVPYLPIHPGTSKPLHEKELPASLDLFGWCTWDAFYSTVSARGLQLGLQGFAAGGVQPRFVIIDDGWQVGRMKLRLLRGLACLPAFDVPWSGILHLLIG